MLAKDGPISRPSPVTRIFTTVQWTMTALLLYCTLGSALVLVVSESTVLSPTTLLSWHPKFLPVVSITAVAIGAVCGAYWPVFNGDSKQRELDLLIPRVDCVKWLSVGLCFITPFSLIGVFTVTEWLTNVFSLGGLLLVCVYSYAYAVGSEAEPTT